MMEMGLLALLYFFEQKLFRNHKVGVRDLSRFLEKTVSGKYSLIEAEYEEIGRAIIQVFRPASGRKRSFTYYNWETGQEETIYTSIIKASSFDSKTGTQYYALDEDGLELIFATKEFYMEFQLSIHQLVLRKQLEKGEFQGALRQINEMHVDVESLQDRMLKLSHDIKRSIVSEETLKKYSSLLDDIYTRLQRENEEFDELRDFVKETKDRIYSDTLQKKQHNAYEYILRISGELEKVHAEHTLLLQQSMEMKNGALLAAKESLYYTGMDSFNFDHDIINLLLGSPLPLEAMRGVISPFMGLEQHSGWSLLTVFAEQNIKADGEEDNSEDHFLEAGDERLQEPFVQWRGSLFRLLMSFLLERLKAQPSILLSEIIEAAKHDDQMERLLCHRAFYDFWIILHQRSPIVSAHGMEHNEEHKSSGMEEAILLLGQHTLIVSEALGIIEVNSRYAIQDMELYLINGGMHDAL